MKQTTERRGAYALHRMCIAIDRILRVISIEEQAQAVKWISVWKDRHTKFLDAHRLAPDP